MTESFPCNNGATTNGQSVYVVGNVPELGNWSPASAVKLSATSYPTWSSTISNLPPNATIEWKCIKRQATPKAGLVVNDAHRFSAVESPDDSSVGGPGLLAEGEGGVV